MGSIAGCQDFSLPGGLCERKNKSQIGEEDLASEVDEPPDEKIRFPRLSIPNNNLPHYQDGCTNMPSQQQIGKTSLLTQALLSSPDLAPTSDAEEPSLTSDGGLTSPTRTSTPSPPLPANPSTGLAIFSPKQSVPDLKSLQIPPEKTVIEKPAEKASEEGLGRRRCITFACGRQSPTSNKGHQLPLEKKPDSVKPTDQVKRPCMLRFVCPMKPSSEAVRKVEHEKQLLKPLADPPSEPSKASSSNSTIRGSEPTITSSPCSIISGSLATGASTRRSGSKRLNLEMSEATRFHEFAGSFNIEAEWIQEKTAHRQKITVNDTLRKENAIRKIADEVEEEALDEGELEEDAQEANESYGNADEVYGNSDFDNDDELSDGGNETDDEEGFADSDDDSDHGSQYQFWNTGLTTAATSTDHIEHIRPMAQRVASISSIESIINTHERTIDQDDPKKRGRKGRPSSKVPKMRPCTPDLPDSTDFVCGTLDEDRPLEAAYMSCLEERRRSRHKIIPQDIDPSFPTSDLDEEDDDDINDLASEASDEPTWVTGRPDNSDQEEPNARIKSIARRTGKSPMPSPKRQRSPHPPKRNLTHRSPPPRCLFSRSPTRICLTSVAPQKLCSPPSSRRTSIGMSEEQKNQRIIIPDLGQRPYLTHTTSLPRTTNPFWRQHRESRINGSDDDDSQPASPTPHGGQRRDLHSRGPINIVKGLENKRQWRREKFWRQQNRHAGKEKERRCQPGKGAERMKELGLEMAGRAKGGNNQKVKLVLSI